MPSQPSLAHNDIHSCLANIVSSQLWHPWTSLCVSLRQSWRLGAPSSLPQLPADTHTGVSIISKGWHIHTAHDAHAGQKYVPAFKMRQACMGVTWVALRGKMRTAATSDSSTPLAMPSTRIDARRNTLRPN